MNVGIEVIAMAAAGFVLHFLGRWGEYSRTKEKVSPLAYVMLDLPAWLYSVLATVVGVPVLTMLVPFESAIPDPDTRLLFEMGAALSFGMNASSYIGKVPGILSAAKAER